MGKLGSAIKAGQTVVELGRNVQSLADTTNEFRAQHRANQAAQAGQPQPGKTQAQAQTQDVPGVPHLAHPGTAHTTQPHFDPPPSRFPDKKELGELGRSAGRMAFNEGADTGKTMGKSWLKTFETVPRLVCRGLQFLFAIIAIGFYGNRVHAEDRADLAIGGEWIFAVLVAGLSALTAVLFAAATPLGAIPVIGSRLKLFKTYRAFPWDFFLFIVWIIVFGVFAGIFLKRGGDEEDRYKGSNTGAMKAAVWIDFVNAIFWLASGVYGAIKTYLGDTTDRLQEKMGRKMFEKKASKEADYAESV